MVNRLGASAGRDNYLRTRADERRDLFAGGFNSSASALAGGVDGGGVAEIAGEIGKQRVEHRRFDGCGGVVVEVDSHDPPTDRITGGSGGWEDARVRRRGAKRPMAASAWRRRKHRGCRSRIRSRSHL